MHHSGLPIFKKIVIWQIEIFWNQSSIILIRECLQNEYLCTHLSQSMSFQYSCPLLISEVMYRHLTSANQPIFLVPVVISPHYSHYHCHTNSSTLYENNASIALLFAWIDTPNFVRPVSLQTLLSEIRQLCEPGSRTSFRSQCFIPDQVLMTVITQIKGRSMERALKQKQIILLGRILSCCLLHLLIYVYRIYDEQQTKP